MRQLLFSVTKKDLKITYFNGQGKGGQNRNKVQNCVRIQHEASGVLVTGQEERSRDQNLKNAFKRLTDHPKFKAWLKVRTAEALMTADERERERQEIERLVEEAMKPENLKIEYFEGV